MLNQLALLMADKEQAKKATSPLQEAAYVAFNKYVSAGHSLADLPWFCLSEKQQDVSVEQHKKAA